MNGEDKETGLFRPVCLALLLVLAAGAVTAAAIVMRREKIPQNYEVRGFSNMCPCDGKVYCGVNGAFGEPVVPATSIFTIQDGKIYYVEKVQEAFESMTDELLTICRSDLDGSNREILVEDVFLAGAGHEKLIGDMLFYGLGYDENYRMQYAAYHLPSGKKIKTDSDRIDNIIGYDGNYMYYTGYDIKSEKNVLGRIFLKTDRDEILVTFPDLDEVGYIDAVQFSDGSLYCLTLKEKPDSYDYRTYTYGIDIRSAKTGEVTAKLPITLTGSANYSFLVQDGELYYAADKVIMAYGPLLSADEGESSLITKMQPEEYWGILHFAPGDGYLYYEAIAQIDEKTGNNDYFYRVPAKGGEPELLKEWFTQ